MIYALYETCLDVIKIGYTGDYFKRRMFYANPSTNGGHDYRFKFLGIANGGLDAEQSIHLMLKAHRASSIKRGREWYLPNQEVLEFINDALDPREPYIEYFNFNYRQAVIDFMEDNHLTIDYVIIRMNQRYERIAELSSKNTKQWLKAVREGMSHKEAYFSYPSHHEGHVPVHYALYRGYKGQNEGTIKTYCKRICEELEIATPHSDSINITNEFRYVYPFRQSA